MDYPRRQAAVRDQLAKLRVDVLLVTHLPNVRYLCGFTGSAGVLALHAGRPVFFTDGRYTEQAHGEVQNARIVIAKSGALTAAAGWASKRGLRAIGLEANHTTLATRAALKRSLGASFKLPEVGGMIERQRQLKDESEIALVRDAVNLGASLLDVAVSAICPGVKETDVAAELEY